MVDVDELWKTKVFWWTGILVEGRSGMPNCFALKVRVARLKTTHCQLGNKTLALADSEACRMTRAKLFCSIHVRSPEHSQGSAIEVLGSPDHGCGTVCPLNCGYLKTFLFRWDSVHCDFFVLMAPGISTLTYLLTLLTYTAAGWGSKISRHHRAWTTDLNMTHSLTLTCFTA